MTRTAHCSCGALRVEVSADPDVVGVCHCGECQRRTGSVFSVAAFYKKEHVRAEGPSNIYVRDGQEGRKVTTHFCPTCGTTVFWEADLRPDQWVGARHNQPEYRWDSGRAAIRQPGEHSSPACSPPPPQNPDTTGQYPEKTHKL